MEKEKDTLERFLESSSRKVIEHASFLKGHLSEIAVKETDSDIREHIEYGASLFEEISKIKV